MTIHYRLLTPADQSVCWEMLMHAAHETNLEAVQSLPELRGYAENWGRDGDRGYGAFDDQKVVGAAWVRLWSAEHPGYGFVAEDIPELAQKMGITTDNESSTFALRMMEAAPKVIFLKHN